MSRKYVLTFCSMVVFGGLVVNAASCGRVEAEKASVAAAQAASTTTINLQCAQVETNTCAGQTSPPISGIMSCCIPHLVATMPGTCKAAYQLDVMSLSSLSSCTGASTDSCSTSSSTPGTEQIDCNTDPRAANPLGPRTIHMICPNDSPHGCTETTTVLDCEAPTIECPASACATADFSSLVTASDNCDQPAVSCAVDNGMVTCTAADTSGNSTTCTFPVVTSGGSPQIQTKSGPSLWPPNHKYHTIDPLRDCVQSMTDPCSGGPVTGATVTINTVTSNEPEDANPTSGNDPNGDGHTCNDIMINGDGTVDLLAERDGTSDGRIYTIYYSVSINGGPSTSETCQVVVPHDQSSHTQFTHTTCEFCAGSGCSCTGNPCTSCATHDQNCNY